MIYELPIEWMPFINERELDNGDTLNVVRVADTPAAILAAMRDLDAEVFDTTGEHRFMFEDTLANSQRNTPAPRREPCSPLRVKCAHYGTERQAEQAKQAQSADCGCPRWRTGMAPPLSAFGRGVLPSPPSASSSPGTCGGGR